MEGVVHRDVKPSNILLNAEGEPKVLIADFSSALHDDVLSLGLYGPLGPSIDEESPQYMPPEALFSQDGHPYDLDYPFAYDSWSVGVLFLEMILGTADVFSVDQRTSALIRHRMKALDREQVDRALLLAALADY
eukprot:gene6457-8245_t